ncbi:MAG TPA: aconitase family protein [Polyangiaceae bacterium]|jgi:aconitate hydratase
MAQKILAGRCADPSLSGDLVQVKVDQIVLARAPARAIAEGVAAGLKKTSVETPVAYEGRCVTDPRTAPSFDMAEMLGHGVLVARPGVGFPSAVHLERFASPARLCVTDEPRLAGVGGAGMLTLVVAPGLLGQALAHGTVWLRPPRSVQVLLSGRVRPFVCARDVALELVRRGLGEVVRRVEAQHRGPVVLEFAGPSVRLLSVGERSVLAGLAPQLGAAAALFTSDERTEVFLRDQRRSKAHRALVPDAGAPCDEVVNLDLGAVDPLLLDEAGQVRTVRDLAGKPVSQVLLGGDSGITLRDLFAAAVLLKSKRVPPRLDLLLAVPSRQMLETLAGAGALADLLATGARLVEPDARVMDGSLYPPPRATRREGLSARTCDPEPTVGGEHPAPFVVASAETLSYAVATGEIGDPRAFKRPVRVTVPRALPTDDVLVVRERRAADAGVKKDKEKGAGPASTQAAPAVVAAGWKGAQTLEVAEAAAWIAAASGAAPASGGNGAASGAKRGPLALLCATLDEVRTVAARVAHAAAGGDPEASQVRAVVAPFVPSGVVALLSGVGVAALEIDPASMDALRDSKESKGAKTANLPPPAQWGEREATTVTVGGAKVSLTWLALGVERAWASAGTAAASRDATKAAAGRGR